MKNLPAKARSLVDSYKGKASAANKRAREAPMKACMQGMFIGPIVGGSYGLLRTQVALFDSTFAEVVTGGSLAAFGMLNGSPAAMHAANAIFTVAAHNFGENLGTADVPTPEETE